MKLLRTAALTGIVIAAVVVLALEPASGASTDKNVASCNDNVLIGHGKAEWRSESNVAGPVGVRVVVGVANVEHRVEQLFFGFEVMQQSGRADPGLPGDLGQRRIAPPIASQQPLGHGKDSLFAILTFGPQRLVRPCLGHRTPLSNQPTEHTVGWLGRP